MTTPAQESSIVRTFGPWLELGLKLGGLLAAAGYLSYRAHLNVFGLSAAGAIDTQRLVLECWNIIFYAVTHYMLLAVFLVPPALLLVRRRLGVMTQTRRAKLLLVGIVFDIASVVWAGVVGWVFVRQLGTLGTDQAIGDLRLHAPNWHADARLFEACFLPSLVFAYGRSVQLRMLEHNNLPAASLVVPFCISTIVIITPIVFGLWVRPPLYPSARLSPGPGGASGCGLLIARSGEESTFWTLDGAVGNTLVVAKERAALMTVGRIHDLASDARAAAQGQMVDLCP